MLADALSMRPSGVPDVRGMVSGGLAGEWLSVKDPYISYSRIQ